MDNKQYYASYFMVMDMDQNYFVLHVPSMFVCSIRKEPVEFKTLKNSLEMCSLSQTRIFVSPCIYSS